MADISWIKLSTGLPDNKKIKRIRKLPDGDKVILFWVFLLSRAGESNKSGGLFLTDTMPYQEEDLAADFDFTVEFVQFALITLERYSMIIRYDEVLFIKNWEEYQAIEGMEKIREQNRLRKQRQREREKMMLGHDNMSRDSHADVTASHATEEEIEKEKSKKENKNKKLEPNDLLAEYLNLFINFANKNIQKKAATQMLFVRLPSFQQQQAVIGARNYIEFYRLDKPEDTTGQYSVNAANFLDNMMFTEFQSKKVPQPKSNNSKTFKPAPEWSQKKYVDNTSAEQKAEFEAYKAKRKEAKDASS